MSAALSVAPAGAPSRDFLSLVPRSAKEIVFYGSASGIRRDHPDAALLALCSHLRVLQAKWQRLWTFTSEDWGLDDPPTTPADHEWLAYNDNVWPAIHISGQTPRHPDDLPGCLLDFHPVTAEGLRAKAAAVLAIEDAAGYGGDSRNDSCELTHSVLVDVSGPARMPIGEDAMGERT